MENLDVAGELERMKDNIRKFATIVKNQIETIDKLEKRVEELESSKRTANNRKVSGDPEKIALVLNLLHKQGYSIQAAADTGLLSYSKTYGVYSWDEKFRTEWLEKYDLVGVFENPLESSALAHKHEALFK